MTTLQSFAHKAQQQLQSLCAVRVRRSHIHELIAAAFGYRSWATFRTQCFLADAGIGDQPERHAEIVGRALHLGYASSIAPVLGNHFLTYIQSQNFRALRQDRLHVMLKEVVRCDEDEEEESDEDEDWFDDEEEPGLRLPERAIDGGISTSPVLLEELAEAALDPALHHLLAQVLRCPKPNPYLYEESLKGRVLNAIEQSWVAQYHLDAVRYPAYEHHLRCAARGGVREAAVAYAEDFDQPEFFKLAQSLSGDVDPMRMARLAQTADDRTQWLREAAEQGSEKALASMASEGDYWAMEQLARDGDNSELRELARCLSKEGDSLRAWALQYFALGHGLDLSRDDYRAYHENGEEYDDDVGGPAFVDGDDAVALPEIPEQVHRQAEQLAEEFAKGRSLFASD